MIAYNASDWGVGWRFFYDGLTLFYNDKAEQATSLKRSLQCTNKNAPILRLERLDFDWLGLPYSKCISNGKLDYMNHYTKENCIFECKGNLTRLGALSTMSTVFNIFIVKTILRECNCTAPFFRRFVTGYRDCSIFDHMFCVKQMMLVR